MPPWLVPYVLPAAGTVALLGACAATGAARESLALPLLVCVPAVVGAAWLGGLRPALLATALAAVLAQLAALGTPTPADAAALLVFGAGAAVAGGVCEALHRARRHEARRAADSEATRTVLEAVMERGPGGFALLDPDLRFVYVNDAFAAIDGVAAEDHLGRRVAEVVPALWPQLAPVYRRVVSREEPLVNVRVVVGGTATAPDQRRHWLGSYYPVRTADGLLGIGVMIADVTDMVRAEERVRESEARYRSLVEATASIVWAADRDGGLVDAPRWETFTGQTPEEYRGARYLDAVHPDDRVATVKAWHRALRDKAPSVLEYRLRRHDGVYRWVTARGVPIVDGFGAVREWVGTVVDVDEAKRAAERLRLREERLRLALEAAAMTAWEWDVERDEVRRAFPAPRGAGRGADAVVGTLGGFLAEIHPDDRAAVEQALRAAAGGGAEYDVEYRVQRAGGALRWCHDRGRLVERTGGARRLAGVTRDVTAAKQAEHEREQLLALADRARTCAEEALEAERRARTETQAVNERITAILASISDGFYALDAEWRWTYFNPQAERHLGRAADEMLGQSPWTLFPELLGSAFEVHYRHAGAERVPVHFEARCPLAGAWLEVHAYPSREGGLSVFFRDVTERKRAEEEREALLAAAEDARCRLEEVVRQMPAGVIIAEAPSGRVLLANEESTRLCGAGPGDVLALETADPDAADEPHERALVQVLAGGEVVRGEEAPLDALDGTPRTVLVSCAPVRDREGRLVAAVATVLDISARKRAEEALRDADRRKDAFLAMLAHQLRNPLAAMRNAVIAARLDDARRARALDIARRQVDELARLVDDLLDLARITQGRITLRKERVFLAQVIDRAVEVARPAVDTRGHALNVSLADENVEVAGDPRRLEQVLVNLLDNAARYSEPGGRIDLSVTRDGAGIVVRVRDTGIGIAADMLPRVFDSFALAERTPDAVHAGLGVGLTVVRRLVELHGGWVEARSDGPGKGAEFVIGLPDQRAEGTAPLPRPLEPLRPSRRARILVVDDNADAAESLTMLLQLFGHQVAVASDAPSALDAARTLPPDVMLIGVGLAGVDGLELARRVRGDVALMGTVLVAVTGFGAVEHDEQVMRAAGFDHHLAQPVDVHALQALVGRISRAVSEEPPTLH